MNVDIIFKIAAIGLIVAVLHQLLSKSGRDELALLTTIAGVIIVLAVVVREVASLFQTIMSVFNF
jgi:stage III sporulation protein AC